MRITAEPVSPAATRWWSATRRSPARHIVIAAGAEPTRLPIEGIEHLALSDDFLELEQLPRRIVLVGGGYIGFEFAHIAARAGASVTMLNRGEQPLAGFDPDLVALLIERTRALGVDLRLGHEVKAVRKTGEGFEVQAEGPEGRVDIATDLAIHSGGRKPALEALDLDAANIAHENGKLKLDKTFRSTSNPAVYAAGDAAGGPLPLTPVAALEARRRSATPPSPTRPRLRTLNRCCHEVSELSCCAG
ncbi:MAG: FAD-dependent oxidoreductase [Woeseiaceae bacterium]|nr:FAD-dependent oxidoreductase [Woeseiaceae bacterium]